MKKIHIVMRKDHIISRRIIRKKVFYLTETDIKPGYMKDENNVTSVTGVFIPIYG